MQDGWVNGNDIDFDETQYPLFWGVVCVPFLPRPIFVTKLTEGYIHN
jgi:hypothetical protein